MNTQKSQPVFIRIEFAKYNVNTNLYEHIGKIKKTCKDAKTFPWVTEEHVFYVKKLGEGSITIEGLNIGSIMIGENNVTALMEVWVSIEENKELIRIIAKKFKELNKKPVWRSGKTIVLRKKVTPVEVVEATPEATPESTPEATPESTPETQQEPVKPVKNAKKVKESSENLPF